MKDTKKLVLLSGNLEATIEVSPWVYQKYIQTCWREKKRMQRKKKYLNTHNINVVSLNSIVDYADKFNTEEIVLQKIASENLIEALRQLPEQDRRLVIDIAVNQMNLSQYAKKLGIPRSTLEYRYKKILSSLKSYLTDSCF